MSNKILYNRFVYILIFGGDAMLGQCIKAKVVKPIGYTDESDYTYPLNCAVFTLNKKEEYAFILGIDHEVRNFDGRIIALLEPHRPNLKKIWIIAPKSTRFINLDILKIFDLGKEYKGYKLICLYESSSGAVVYRKIGKEIRYLLIKNKRSSHWGFPKGHLEKGESNKDAALREVLEETGIHLKIHDGFESVSKYMVRGRIDKRVSIFVGTTDDVTTVIQEAEIEEYIWLTYNKALPLLKFENDKVILKKAHNFLIENNYISKEN